MLRRLILDYKDDPARQFHVLFLDIKGFKKINDSLGHTIGDKVLMIAAKRFTRMVNPDDVVARIGGDELTSPLISPLIKSSSATSRPSARHRRSRVESTTTSHSRSR